jgi:phage-related minor tail protein
MSVKKLILAIVVLVVLALSLPYLGIIIAALMEALAQVVTSLEGVAR